MNKKGRIWCLLNTISSSTGSVFWSGVARSESFSL